MSVATSSVKQAINAKEPVKSLWVNPTGQFLLAFIDRSMSWCQCAQPLLPTDLSVCP